MEKNNKLYVYDYETVFNCFLGVFINIENPDEINVFEISDFKNDIDAYNTFMLDCINNKTLLISYNGLNFDNQISRYILDNYNYLSKKENKLIAKAIYKTAQDVITRSNTNQYPLYNSKDNPFNECDILAINNYDNPAKRCSLKWLQYSMDWYNVEDMSTNHSEEHTEEQIIQLLNYCVNDCLATKELYYKNYAEILLRKELSKHFALKLDNHSEPKLAKSIFLKLLSEKLKINPNELKKKQTYRKIINLNEAILPYIKFITPDLQKTLTQFKSLKLDGENLAGTFAHKTTYKGLELSFALGGIHGAKKGIYKCDKDFIIKSFDVTSFYPNLSIRNNWAPGHINQEAFCEIYEGFFEERKKYSKKDPLNYVYKILLNSTYGLSNEKNSFLKDSMFTMKITCNGQLLLVMLIEDLCENIPGSRPIMVNTDGGEIIIPREHEELYHTICKKWETLTKLNLEFESYDKLIIPDVNNYIGIYIAKIISKEDALFKIKNEFPKPLIKKNKAGEYLLYNIKTKGRFEVDKPLHKNKSFRIKRIAYYNYFIHNISPEETLSNQKNIYDYCAGARSIGGWKFKALSFVDNNLKTEYLQKTIRYYVSKEGCKIIKVKDNREIKLEASKHLEKVLNRYEEKEFEDYLIDTSYYLKTINKEILNINPIIQQTLF